MTCDSKAHQLWNLRQAQEQLGDGRMLQRYKWRCQALLDRSKQMLERALCTHMLAAGSAHSLLGVLKRELESVEAADFDAWWHRTILTQSQTYPEAASALHQRLLSLQVAGKPAHVHLLTLKMSCWVQLETSQLPGQLVGSTRCSTHMKMMTAADGIQSCSLAEMAQQECSAMEPELAALKHEIGAELYHFGSCFKLSRVQTTVQARVRQDVEQRSILVQQASPGISCTHCRHFLHSIAGCVQIAVASTACSCISEPLLMPFVSHTSCLQLTARAADYMQSYLMQQARLYDRDFGIPAMIKLRRAELQSHHAAIRSQHASMEEDCTGLAKLLAEMTDLTQPGDGPTARCAA